MFCWCILRTIDKFIVSNTLSVCLFVAGEGAVACSHERSYEYYTESILSACPFKAYPCTSAGEYAKGNCLQCGSGCASMGYYADQSTARGSMFLDTTDTAPYCGKILCIIIWFKYISVHDDCVYFSKLKTSKSCWNQQRCILQLFSSYKIWILKWFSFQHDFKAMRSHILYCNCSYNMNWRCVNE